MSSVEMATNCDGHGPEKPRVSNLPWRCSQPEKPISDESNGPKSDDPKAFAAHPSKETKSRKGQEKVEEEEEKGQPQ
jgi:hypothetical protein